MRFHRLRRGASGLAAILSVAAVGPGCCLPASVGAAEEPGPLVSRVGVEQVEVYVSGQDGYHTYRIPAVIRAANGDLLAFCEGRKNSGSDTGDIDLLLKRSRDDGRTWGPAQRVWSDGVNTCGNPCPVLDGTTGTLWLLATHNRGEDAESDIHARRGVGTRTVWVLSSTDHGLRWSAPKEITATTKDPVWNWYATGPGVGIQLRDGAHAGRLVVPCDHGYRVDDTGRRDSGAHVIYSDDHGQTWRLGGVVRPKANEAQVVELPDGRGTLLMNIRSARGVNRRLESLSTDGGQNWTPPRVSALEEPVCQASILRQPSRRAEGGAVLLFSNPAHGEKRLRLTVRLSADHGRSWRVLHELHAGPSAYSCLVSLGETEAGCLYERGDRRPYETITFARFKVPTR